MFGDAHVVPRKQEFNMILTVTMNPSIDTRYQLDKLIIDDVNRVTPEKTAGGKGLNVSRVLLQLGDDVLATGLLGGHMGAYMAELMDADGVKNDFVPIAGETRICLNILHEGNQTELLESGPQIAPAELDAFTAKFAELAAKADVVTLSGSLPRGVDAGYYADLVKIAEEAGAKVLLDTSGASLEAALESDAKPELVKPNLTEINGLLGTSFTTDDVDALREAVFPGLSSRWVLPVRWASTRAACSAPRHPRLPLSTRRVPVTRRSLALRMPSLPAPMMLRCLRLPIPAASSTPWIPRPATWSWTAGTRSTTALS